MSITAWSNSFLVFLESSVVGVSIKMPDVVDVVPKPSQTKSIEKIQSISARNGQILSA